MAALVLAAVCCLGCGSPGRQSAEVSGRVTLDDAPVEEGEIIFAPVDLTAGSASGGPIRNGAYSIAAGKGPVPVVNRVIITWQRKTGRKIHPGPPVPPGETVDETAEAIPEKYNKKTTLEKEVKAGKNSFDFELQSK